MSLRCSFSCWALSSWSILGTAFLYTSEEGSIGLFSPGSSSMLYSLAIGRIKMWCWERIYNIHSKSNYICFNYNLFRIWMIACFFTLEDICIYMYNSNILNKNLKRRQLNTHSVEGLLPGLLMYFCPLISIGAVGGTNKVTACRLTSRTNQTNHTNNANNNNQLYTPTKKPSAQPNLSKHGQCPPHIPSPGRPSGSFL